MPVPLLVTTTVESRGDAEKLSRVLLEKRLIACSRIAGPESSSYWWQGEIVSAQEYVLTMKSDDSRYKELEQVLLELHPYDVPEIAATAMTHVSDGYRQWLEKELRR